MFSAKIILSSIHPPWSTNHRKHHIYRKEKKLTESRKLEWKIRFSKAFNFRYLIYSYNNSVLFKSMLSIERRRHNRLAGIFQLIGGK
jgi:hypothetical protein